MLIRRAAARKTVGTVVVRRYHDQSFGYREPRKLKLPDYTSSELENRTVNASLLRYVDSVRQHGHRAAKIDPLDMLERDPVHALDPSRYGLHDMEKEYSVHGILWNQNMPEGPEGGESLKSETWKLKDIVEFLRSVYVGRIAYEFMHSPSKSERLWFTHLLESAGPPKKSPMENGTRKRMWELLARSETFDHFLQAKFPNLKRYGLEGAESMLPALDSLFRTCADAGVSSIILCMPHRGRLSLLTDLLQFNPTALFHKIKGGNEIPEGIGATGDVISHLAASPILKYGDKQVKVSLLQNPSHLEAVNPVALGKTRAKQYSMIRDSSPDCALGDKVMCVQLHGDAAFTGQGVVMETLGLSNLPHYTTGGSIHIVVNNNIGYTTPASGARSSFYCSDIGKMVNAPVLHVNGDYPEDVARAVNIAFAYRNFFRKDIIIDLMCYRQWGHNELDEPSYTSPKMYKHIRSRPSVPKMYEEKLINEGSLSVEDAKTQRTAYKSHLESCLQAVESYSPPPVQHDKQWKNVAWPASTQANGNPETGVEPMTLTKIGKSSVEVPNDFALAFGSLLLDGYDVRISGQDVGRGTFSQRHAMLVDQETEKVVVPLNSLSQSRKLELANSSLSEMAVLGFEYGVSWERPDILPIWEAQFGDFFNGSQVIIDTFISSSETKWLKQSGLVMLLPHGLDGAGPEHSSSRIERMLQ
ncbi:hypothetical protein FRB90_008510, partial [Tulasnella sp. 427]